MSYLKDRMNEYREKEFEIAVLEEQIKSIQENQILPIRKNQKKEKEELEELGKETFDFRLGDLIKSLSKLSGIEEESIYVHIDYNDIWTMKNFQPIDFYNRAKKPLLRLTIASRKPYTFSFTKPKENDFQYNFFFESDFQELQGDGHSLLEHSYTLRERFDGISKSKIQTSLYISDDNKEDIICHLNLRDLASSIEYKNHFPNDLLLEAIENIEKDKGENAIKKIKQLKI